MKNSTLLSSTLECSKSLTTDNLNKKLLFTLNVDETDPLLICKKYKNKIIDQLLKYKAIINAQYMQNDRIKILFLPHRFDIIIKNQTAYFYLKGD